MILVLGATGLVGGATLARLAELGAPTRALVRRAGPAPAPLTSAAAEPEVVLGDADDPASLRRAMAGVQQVFLVMANGARQQQRELAVVHAAAEAGVEHLVKLSAPYVTPDSPVAIARMHHAIEQEILTAGNRSALQHTFLRPYAFMHNLLNIAPTIRMAGFFAGTTGDTALNMVDVRDIADVAATALTTTRTRGRALVLTGPRAVTYPQVAEILTRLGRPTRYLDMRPAEYAAGLRRAHLPEWVVEHLIEIQQMALTHPESPNGTVEEITGRTPRDVDTFLVEHLEAFSRPRGLRERIGGVPVRLAAHRSARASTSATA